MNLLVHTVLGGNTLDTRHCPKETTVKSGTSRHQPSTMLSGSTSMAVSCILLLRRTCFGSMDRHCHKRVQFQASQVVAAVMMPPLEALQSIHLAARRDPTPVSSKGKTLNLVPCQPSPFGWWFSSCIYSSFSTLSRRLVVWITQTTTISTHAHVHAYTLLIMRRGHVDPRPHLYQSKRKTCYANGQDPRP